MFNICCYILSNSNIWFDTVLCFFTTCSCRLLTVLHFSPQTVHVSPPRHMQTSSLSSLTLFSRLATLVDWTSAGAGWRALCIFTMRLVGSLHPILKEDFSSAFFGPNYKLFKISYLMTLIDVKIKLPRGAKKCTAKIFLKPYNFTSWLEIPNRLE